MNTGNSVGKAWDGVGAGWKGAKEEKMGNNYNSAINKYF